MKTCRFMREGLSKGIPDSAFSKRELAKGIKVELEHTSSRAVAKKIAKDHLVEDRNYYRKLAIMEETPYEEYKKRKRRGKKTIFPTDLGIPYFDLGFRVI